jgi:hypothetical protein
MCTVFILTFDFRPQFFWGAGGLGGGKKNWGPVPAVWGTLQISLIFMEDWVIECEMVGEGGGLCFSCEFWHGGSRKNKQVLFHTVTLPFTLKKS